jgi:hypothetical protein
MKSMCPEKRFAKLSFALFILIAVFAAGVTAQTRRTASSKKAETKKSTAKSKDARKVTSKKAVTAKKDTKRTSGSRSKAVAAKTPVKKLTAREKARLERDSRSNKKMTAAERRKEAARRKAEEARRAAALAEQRRREQAAREARARRLAFERGLKTATQTNILNDVTEGEDLQVRQAAVNALGDRAGTVVVMESKTGRVVTMVNQDWAIRDSFKPCSTIKLVTGVAGVSENVIDQEGNIVGESSRMDLNDALAYSNNGYFQRVGVKMGNSKMIEYAKDLGLGQKTGINAEGEVPGKLPYGNNNARVYSHGDDFEVTPLQLAVMVSAIANNGQKVVPFIPRTRTEASRVKANFHGNVGLPQRTIEGVIPGMIGAAEYGTARRGVDSSMGVAGKTGSCIGKGTWVGLFASVAPVEDPKYAVVVITRGQGERGKYAAAVAGRVYEALNGRFGRNQERYLALKNQHANRPANTQMLAEADDEEEDDEGGAADAEFESPRKVIVAGSQQNTVIRRPVEAKKIVTRTAQSKPVFAPVVIQYKKDTELKDPAPKTRPRVVKNK